MQVDPAPAQENVTPNVVVNITSPAKPIRRLAPKRLAPTVVAAPSPVKIEVQILPSALEIAAVIAPQSQPVETSAPVVANPAPVAMETTTLPETVQLLPQSIPDVIIID